MDAVKQKAVQTYKQKYHLYKNMFQLFLTMYCPVLSRDSSDGSLVEEKKYAHHTHCTYLVAPLEERVAAAQELKDGKKEAACQQELTRLVAHNESVLKRAQHAKCVRQGLSRDLHRDLRHGTGTAVVVNGVVTHVRSDMIRNHQLYVRDNNAYCVYPIHTRDSVVPAEWQVLADAFHKTYGPTGYRSIQTGDVRSEPLEPALLSEAYELAKMRGRRDGFLRVRDSPITALHKHVFRQNNPFGVVQASNGLNEHAVQFKQTQDQLYERATRSAKFIVSQYQQAIDQEHARVISNYYKHLNASTPAEPRLQRAIRATWSQPPEILTPLDRERLCASYVTQVSTKGFRQRWAFITQELQEHTKKYLSEWT